MPCVYKKNLLYFGLDAMYLHYMCTHSRQIPEVAPKCRVTEETTETRASASQHWRSPPSIKLQTQQTEAKPRRAQHAFKKRRKTIPQLLFVSFSERVLCDGETIRKSQKAKHALHFPTEDHVLHGTCSWNKGCPSPLKRPMQSTRPTLRSICGVATTQPTDENIELEKYTA